MLKINQKIEVGGFQYRVTRVDQYGNVWGRLSNVARAPEEFLGHLDEVVSRGGAYVAY